MSQQYEGGIVTKTPTTPTVYAAPGVWTLDQQAYYQAQGVWPLIPSSISNSAWISYGTISALDTSWQTNAITYDVFGNVFTAGYYNTGSENDLLFFCNSSIIFA